MTHDRDSELGAGPEWDANTISPLPGEPGIPNVAARQGIALSKKGLLAIALLIGSLVAVLAFTIQRVSASGRKADEESKLVRDQPTAATAEPRKLEMPPAPAASAAVAVTPRIPALVPTADEVAEPIGVRRTGAGAPASGEPKVAPPEDAPVLLVSIRPGALATLTGAASARGDADPATEQNAPADPVAATAGNLQGYQRQLQGLLDNLTKSAALATARRPARCLRGHSLVSPRSQAPNTAASPRAWETSSGASFRAPPLPRWLPRCSATAASCFPRAQPSPAR